ncbi:MAG: inorganic diphosphatase, partial [Rubrivivax sp.]
QWQQPADMNPMRLKTIQHFFEHYKDLEEGKWVKVLGWEGADAAREEIRIGSAAWTDKHGEPAVKTIRPSLADKA